MSVNVNGTHLVFDSNGNPNIGYNLIEWTWEASGVEFLEVGSFNDELIINRSLFKWHTENSEVFSAIVFENVYRFVNMTNRNNPNCDALTSAGSSVHLLSGM